MDSVKRASTLAQAFAGFLPTPLLRRVLKNNPPLPGETEITQAVSLYADFSGMTAITSIIETAGDSAIEALNTLLTAITEPIFANGGVIASFDGDALIAYFPYPEHSTLKAVTCAAQMRAALDRVAPELKPHEFSLRIGLGVGTLTLITIGEANQWLEFCLTGASLNRAISAAHWVNRNAVIVHSSVLNILGDNLPIEPAEPDSGRDENFYTVRTDLLLTENETPIGYTPLEGEIPPELDTMLKQVLPDVVAREVERSYAYALAERRLIETRDSITMYMAFVGADYNSLDAGAKLFEYMLQMARIIHRFDGYVFQVMLDDRGGLLRIAFPADTNISQALNCALAFQNTPFAREKEQRISITQGTLFIGSIGSSYWRAYVALGGGVGIARRLCERAQPGQIVVDGEIEHLTESDFRFATLPALMIKGPATPIRSYLLEGLHTIDNDLAAAYLRRKHTLIGRVGPLAQLIGKVDATWAGQGSTIEIIGAAGVGKSRLIEEIVSDWSIRGGSGYLATSPVFGRNAPYSAWAQLWTTIFGLRITDSADTRRDKVTRFLADLNPTFSIKLNMVVMLFWKVLSLIDQTPELVQDARSLQYLFAEISVTVLKAMAAKNPLLLVFDNCQWADSGTVMALNYLAAHLSGSPILLITEHRPTVEPLDLHSDVRIELPGLTHDEGVQFITQIVGDVGFPDSLHSKLGLVEGRPCNPLQIEQALALMISAGALQPAPNGINGYRYNPTERFNLPSTFSDVIAARIEQLDAATRTIIQTAAALGTEFSFPILRMLNEATFTDEVLEALLDKLNKADLTVALNHHTRMQRRDRFSHPLIQETIYENLPSSRRRTLHLAIAEELARHREGKYPSQVGYADANVGSSRVDLQACKLEYSIVSPK